MARTVVVRAGDSLTKIAANAYGDGSLALKLAKYNGITNPDLISVGEVLAIPSRKELEGGDATDPVAAGITPPNGLDEVVATFGNISAYIRDDGHLSPNWESEHLANAKIPFAIPLSWERTQQVKNIYCHKLLTDIVSDVFSRIESEGLTSEVRTFGGCFNYRPKRQSSKFSTHCWGIAIDLNPETNRQGASGDIHPEIVHIFRDYGFKWGGDWTGKSKDPMHFQFCNGY